MQLRATKLTAIASAVKRAFNISSLFSGGAPGVWYDPSDLTTLFQDSAGTTPVTAVEQPVGLMLDKSQGLVLGSEIVTPAANQDFSSDTGYWNKTGTTSIGGGVCNIAGTTNNGINRDNILVLGKYYQIQFEIKRVGSGAIYALAGTNGSPTFNTLGVKQVILTPANNLQVRFWAVGTTDIDIDNISVKELPGNHAFQATSASRPVLSARYNLLTKTEQFDDAVWVKTGLQPFGSGSIVNATTAPDGTLTADFICENSSAGFHRLDSGVGVSYIAGTSITSTIRVKSTTRNYSPYLGNASGAITATFNLSNGTVSVAASNIGTASGATASITQDAQGFWLCTLSGVVSTSSSTNAIFYHQIVSGTNASYTGDGTSGIYIWGASIVPANQSTLPYQRVNTATDYATAGFLPYLKFDGVDDSLSTNSISFTSTDKMSVFAGVRKLSDAALGAVVELSATINSNNGSFVMYAPASNGASNYQFTAKGTFVASATGATYAAPITNVVSGLADIPSSTAAAVIRVNGATIQTTGFTAGTGNFGNYPLYIGRRGGSSLPFNGQLYSMVIVGKAVTAGELSNTETFVATKTGVLI